MLVVLTTSVITTFVQSSSETDEALGVTKKQMRIQTEHKKGNIRLSIDFPKPTRDYHFEITHILRRLEQALHFYELTHESLSNYRSGRTSECLSTLLDRFDNLGLEMLALSASYHISQELIEYEWIFDKDPSIREVYLFEIPVVSRESLGLAKSLYKDSSIDVLHAINKLEFWRTKTTLNIQTMERLQEELTVTSTPLITELNDSIRAQLASPEFKDLKSLFNQLVL